MRDGECELGMGLHNEPGARKLGGAVDGERIVASMVEMLLTSGRKRKVADQAPVQVEEAKHKEHKFFHFGGGAEKSSPPKEENDAFVRVGKDAVDDVVLFVNNLGGISQLEMGAIVDETLSQLGTLLSLILSLAEV